VDDVREGLSAFRIHDRGARVVAGCLYGQDHGLFRAFGRVEETGGLLLIFAWRH
jgi:hypothetical protein